MASRAKSSRKREPKEAAKPVIPGRNRTAILRLVLLVAVGGGAFAFAYGWTKWRRDVAPAEDPPGMVWIPGGEFMMGSDAEYASMAEKPAHRVRLDGFWIDETDVTNAQFREFVEATGYVTTAEKPVDVEEILKQSPPGTPAPPPEKLVPGSLVFQPTPGPVKDFRDYSQWWH